MVKNYLSKIIVSMGIGVSGLVSCVDSAEDLANRKIDHSRLEMAVDKDTDSITLKYKGAECNLIINEYGELFCNPYTKY